MTITVNTKAYNADVASSPNSLPYFGPAQTVSVSDKFDLYRTAAKPTKDFSGMARARVKLSRTATLTSALTPTGLATVDCNFSIPVGMASADVDALIADIAAGLAQQWTKDLVKSHDLNS
jgi:hypothetical protein